jgi:hypothetical protein
MDQLLGIRTVQQKKCGYSGTVHQHVQSLRKRMTGENECTTFPLNIYPRNENVISARKQMPKHTIIYWPALFQMLYKETFVMVTLQNLHNNNHPVRI